MFYVYLVNRRPTPNNLGKRRHNSYCELWAQCTSFRWVSTMPISSEAKLLLLTSWPQTRAVIVTVFKKFWQRRIKVVSVSTTILVRSILLADMCLRLPLDWLALLIRFSSMQKVAVSWCPTTGLAFSRHFILNYLLWLLGVYSFAIQKLLPCSEFLRPVRLVVWFVNTPIRHSSPASGAFYVTLASSRGRHAWLFMPAF